MELTRNNFTVDSSSNPPKLLAQIRGYSVVIFYMPTCEMCKKLKPIIQNLATVYANRISLAWINVSQHSDIARISKNSTTPVTETPTMIFYNNGDPKMKIKSTLDPKALKQSFDACLERMSEPQIQQRQDYTGPQLPGQRFEQAGQSSMDGVFYLASNNKTLNIPTGITPYNNPWIHPSGQR